MNVRCHCLLVFSRGLVSLLRVLARPFDFRFKRLRLQTARQSVVYPERSLTAMYVRLVSGGQSEITYVAPMLKTMSFFRYVRPSVWCMHY